MSNVSASSEANFIESGEYMNAIQRLINHQNAADPSISSVSAETQPNSDISLTLKGNLFGSGPTASVSINLSPEAQAAISMEQLALALITPTDKNSQSESQQDSSQSQNQQKAKQAPNANVPSASSGNDVTSTATSVAGILEQAQQTLNSDPSAIFYAAVNDLGGPAQFISYNSNADLQKSFVEAFNSGSLTFQTSAQTPQLGWVNDLTITGTSMPGTFGWNTNTVAQLDAKNGTYSSGIEVPGVGGVYVTWANPSAASTTSSPSSKVNATA